MPRSTYYHRPRPESAENLRLLRRLDELYMDCPFFGSRRMAVTLEVNRKRIQRLMRILGIEALYPKPNLSRPAPGHVVYPYLLRGVAIERPNHVWSTDITYIPMRGGFLYLVAVMDWFTEPLSHQFFRHGLEAGLLGGMLEVPSTAWGDLLPPPGTKKSVSVMLLSIALKSRAALNALKMVPYVGLLNTPTSPPGGNRAGSAAGGACTNPVPSGVVKSAPRVT